MASPSSRAPLRGVVLARARARAHPHRRTGLREERVCRRLVAADGRFTLYSPDDMIVEEADEHPDIVDTRGWAWFRDLEYDVCVKAARLAREDASGWTLIDAGGGVVVDLDENGNETYSQRKVRRRRDDPHSRAAFVASPPRPSFARSFRRVAAATLIRARRPNLVAFPSCVSSPLASPLPLIHRNPLSQIETLRGERNVIVYLKRDVAYLLNRTSGDKNRPSPPTTSRSRRSWSEGRRGTPRGGLHRRARRGGGIGGEDEERDQGGSVELLRGDGGGTPRVGVGVGGDRDDGRRRKVW